MNLLKTRAGVALAFAASSIVATPLALASWSPIGFGIVGVEGAQMPGPDDSVYGLNMGLLGGKLDTMCGISVATFGMFTGETAGIEVSGLFNVARSSENGVIQIAGLANTVKDGGQGLQISGLANNGRDFTGIQIAAVGNYATGSSRGLQIGVGNMGVTPSDLANPRAVSYDSYTGVQIGVFNTMVKPNDLSDSDFSGVQIGFSNDVDDGGGVQIGVFNGANGRFDGLQVGAINTVGSLNGVQIGAVNYVKSSIAGVQLGVFNVFADGNVAMAPFLRIAL